MFQIETSVIINRPIADVFEFIADNENDPQWCVPVVETTRIVGDKPGLNTRYSFAADGGLITPRGEFDITAFQPPEFIVWEGYSPFSLYKGQYNLKQVAEGTRLDFSVTFTNKGLYRLLESSMHKRFEEQYAEQFSTLKQLLEA